MSGDWRGLQIRWTGARASAGRVRFPHASANSLFKGGRLVRIEFLFVELSILTFLIACNSPSQPINNSLKQDLSGCDRDGLVGAVKAVLTDDVIIGEKNGRQVETQQASSTSIYDESGKRTTQTPFRVSNSGGYAIVQHDPMFNPQARRQRTEEQIPNQGGKWIKNCDDKGYMTEGIRMTPVEGKSKASR